MAGYSYPPLHPRLSVVRVIPSREYSEMLASLLGHAALSDERRESDAALVPTRRCHHRPDSTLPLLGLGHIALTQPTFLPLLARARPVTKTRTKTKEPFFERPFVGNESSWSRSVRDKKLRRTNLLNCVRDRLEAELNTSNDASTPLGFVVKLMYSWHRQRCATMQSTMVIVGAGTVPSSF
ncbi:hypothetical protein BDP27DRAFT_1369835 [Rhodocollybia butyracea]|uniref:Uncharacterized protein n=1 Tax=Rhodocollybia butyracea TaxID=206335 RepID=A0A9P5U0B1_9AGAR|nr:hypothetical protein BDP27DRAFT_1369835 [Rhodocollybia butyracea]